MAQRIASDPEAPIGRDAVNDLERRGIFNPYPGLRPYLSHEYDLFYGRERQTAEVIGHLARSHFVAILGASGCGKSSLVRAGVIPELQAFGIPGAGDCWLAVQYTPGRRPLDRLAEALADATIDAAGTREKIANKLRFRNGLTEAVSSIRGELRIDEGPSELRKEANILLLVDQFEEVFRDDRLSSDQAAELVRLLVEQYEVSDSRIYVALTMRSEFLSDCAIFLRLPDVLNETSYLVRRMDDRELMDAVVKPADQFARHSNAAEVCFDDGVIALIQAYIDELKGSREIVKDSLPLMQHFLFRMWRAAQQREGKNLGACVREIQRCDLENAIEPPAVVGEGGPEARKDGPVMPALARCLDKHAEATFRGASKASEAAVMCERMFRALGTKDDKNEYKRRRASISELAKDSKSREVLGKVLSEFSAPHPYLRLDGDEIDVAHEALIRCWQRLREWIDDERNRVDVVRMLVREYRDYRQAPQEALLLGQKALNQVEEAGVTSLPAAIGGRYLKASYDPDVVALDDAERLRHFGRLCEFVAQSRKQLDWKARLRRWGWVSISGAVLVMVALSVWSWINAQDKWHSQEVAALAQQNAILSGEKDKGSQALAVAAVSRVRGFVRDEGENIFPLWQLLSAAAAVGNLQAVHQGFVRPDDEAIRAHARLAERQVVDGLRNTLVGNIWLQNTSPLPGKAVLSTEVVNRSPDNLRGLYAIDGGDGKQLQIYQDKVFVISFPRNSKVVWDRDLRFLVASIGVEGQSDQANLQVYELNWYRHGGSWRLKPLAPKISIAKDGVRDFEVASDGVDTVQIIGVSGASRYRVVRNEPQSASAAEVANLPKAERKPGGCYDGADREGAQCFLFDSGDGHGVQSIDIRMDDGERGFYRVRVYSPNPGGEDQVPLSIIPYAGEQVEEVRVNDRGELFLRASDEWFRVAWSMAAFARLGCEMLQPIYHGAQVAADQALQKGESLDPSYRTFARHGGGMSNFHRDPCAAWR